ncbi:hypothetical protein JCM18920_1169 [Cutibacterium acnes JCM 18920]|nr:hypothetical protein JCM18920_1169 [Cutibacterium acnes JCM 18920]
MRGGSWRLGCVGCTGSGTGSTSVSGPVLRVGVWGAFSGAFQPTPQLPCDDGVDVRTPRSGDRRGTPAPPRVGRRNRRQWSPVALPQPPSRRARHTASPRSRRKGWGVRRSTWPSRPRTARR